MIESITGFLVWTAFCLALLAFGSAFLSCYYARAAWRYAKIAEEAADRAEAAERKLRRR